MTQKKQNQELKTLKDLIWDNNDELFVNRLKAEAIKWVKSFYPFNSKGKRI